MQEIEKYRSEFYKNESKLVSTQGELAKANEIIRKFQSEAKTYQLKLKNKLNCLNEKDANMTARKKELEALKSELSVIQNDKKLVEEKLEAEKKNSNDASVQLEAFKQQLVEKESLINYLNSKLDAPSQNFYQNTNRKNNVHEKDADAKGKFDSLISSYFPNIQI